MVFDAVHLLSLCSIVVSALYVCLGGYLLRSNPRERLNQVFRATHTLKSSAAIFDYDAMTALMHASEDLLDVLRSGDLELNSAMVDQLLDGFDTVEQWVDYVEAHEAMPEGTETIAAELIAGLQRLIPVEFIAADSPLATLTPAWRNDDTPAMVTPSRMKWSSPLSAYWSRSTKILKFDC